MAKLTIPKLAEVLQEAKMSFSWNEFTRTWQLDRTAYGSNWHSVMYLANSQDEAEKNAVEHIKNFYLDEDCHSFPQRLYLCAPFPE